MAPVLFFAFLLTLPARGLAARLSARSSEEVPWRSKAVIGALLGPAHWGDVAVGMLDRDFGTGRDLTATEQGDAYDQVLASLINIFGGGSSTHKAAFGKLIESLRRSESVEDVFMQTVQARLSGENVEYLQHFTVGIGVEQFLIPPGGDRHGVAIVRYPSHDHPSPGWVSFVKQTLLGAELSRLEAGIFLPYIAESHTIEEFAKDTGAEVLLMNELCIGTLGEVVEASHPDYDDRLDLFLNTFLVVQRLNNLEIPHRSEITPDTVLVRRERTDWQEAEVVLSPEIIVLDSGISAEDSLNSDIRQLGTLLRFLFSGEFERGYEPIIDVLFAFGKAMESGAFQGMSSAAVEVHDLVHRTSPGVAHHDLVAFRLKYLRLAVEAERTEQHQDLAAG